MKRLRRHMLGAGLAVAATAAVLAPGSPAFALSRTCYTSAVHPVCTTANLYSSAYDWVRLTTFGIPSGGSTWCRLFDADNGQQVADLYNSYAFAISETTGGLYGRYYAICTQYNAIAGSGGSASNT